jgi:hypothetical protein
MSAHERLAITDLPCRAGLALVAETVSGSKRVRHGNRIAR